MKHNNPTGPKTGLTRGCRGGAWLADADNGRSAYRNWHDPGYCDYNLGFRLVRRIQK